MRRSIILAFLLVLGACGTDSSDDGALRIVATTSILGDIAAEVVGDDAEIEVLLPRGADPHDFQLSPQQVASLSTADLVIANGLGLEESAGPVLEGARSDGVNVIEVGPFVEPLEFGGHTECDPEAEEECDPHFWLDPMRVALAAQKIAAEMESLSSGEWSNRASEYAERLDALDAEMATLFDGIPEERRLLVTNHDALGYFASRYGFELIGTVVPGGGTLGDPSSEELAELVRLIVEREVPAIFEETNEPAALARAVADEVGEEVEVVALFTGTLGEPGETGDTLIEMLRENAMRIEAALR